MHKMPRIWIMFLETLTEQKLITRTRTTFDRALCALPVTQHDRIWELYLRFVGQEGIPIETALRVYRRYLMYDPTHVEKFIDFLVKSACWQEAAERLASMLNDDTFHSIQGKTKHTLWMELCEFLVEHASEISGLNVDAIIRGGISKFTYNVGTLWTCLAEYYYRKDMIEKGRDIFEEGLMKVVTVKDFDAIFEVYMDFEEETISQLMKTSSSDEENGAVDEEDVRLNFSLSVKELQKRITTGFWLNDADDVDFRIKRCERLGERRPELRNSVILKQNPHNVAQWHRRVQMFQGNVAKQCQTYAAAVRTVDPMKAVGRPHTLWVDFAKLYENHNDLVNTRAIFETAVQANYKEVDHLASVWCEWAKMELRHQNFKRALDLMRRATAKPTLEVRRKVSAAGGNEPVQMQLYRSSRLWSYYVDLEEALGTLESTRAVYEKIFEFRAATPEIILHYAYLLEGKGYYEDAFQVYERGVNIFKYPHVKDIWLKYLTKFVERYGKTKLEHARDLFQRAVSMATSGAVRTLYLKYAKLEEDYGLAERATKVYEEASKRVPPDQKLEMYKKRLSREPGVPKRRDIYFEAINDTTLPHKDEKILYIEFAEMETSVGEFDRARAIYDHASKFSDPRSDHELWNKWQALEVQHGDENTCREMLRIKRDVSESYSQAPFMDKPVDAKDSEWWVTFVRAGVTSQSGENEDEHILLGGGDDESDGEDEMEIAQKEVPAEEGGENLGALERIKKQKHDRN